jgi:CHASE3 domain sensor protein
MKLRGYAAGDHVTPMRHGHGDCQKISWIYDTYLNTWFADVLKPEESEELRKLFRELSESDSYMVDALMQTANWLQQEAEETVILIQQEDYEGAQRRVGAVWGQWTPLMEDLHRSSQRLWDLQRAFIESNNPLRG